MCILGKYLIKSTVINKGPVKNEIEIKIRHKLYYNELNRKLNIVPYTSSNRNEDNQLHAVPLTIKLLCSCFEKRNIVQESDFQWQLVKAPRALKQNDCFAALILIPRAISVTYFLNVRYKCWNTSSM